MIDLAFDWVCTLLAIGLGSMLVWRPERQSKSTVRITGIVLILIALDVSVSLVTV